MSKLQIRGKEIRGIGYPEGPVISLAIHAMSKHYKHYSLDDALQVLKNVMENPKDYKEDKVLGKIAEAFLPKTVVDNGSGLELPLNTEGVHFNTFGAEFIEKGAFDQMHTAVKLPVAVAGALMPDAHHGYGLPIGGVLATQNAVIPYGVGVDIGCRMCLSIFDADIRDLTEKEAFFTRELLEATLFGTGAEFKKPASHEVLERAEFREIGLLRELRDKAYKQLGSSGSGNHFAEFGIVEIPEKDDALGVNPGSYVGLLTHSGSRALGANIAAHYTKLARQKRRLPQEAAHLSWLNLDEQEGAEYWLAMNLAGDYASACHHIIHAKISKQLGRSPVTMVENHHNFAWREKFENKDVIVHRKGATPAGKNVLGIIPGSMTAPGFIVKGKGEEASINSASHGAGRKMSRTAALATVTHKALQEALTLNNVKLLGGGLDEAPFAYKDIEQVMQSQKSLVDIVGKFTPKIVRMSADAPKQWRKTKKVLTGE